MAGSRNRTGLVGAAAAAIPALSTVDGTGSPLGRIPAAVAVAQNGGCLSLIMVTTVAIPAFRTVGGTGRHCAGVPAAILMAQSRHSPLRSQDGIADRALAAFGQTSCRTSGCHCRNALAGMAQGADNLGLVICTAAAVPTALAGFGAGRRSRGLPAAHLMTQRRNGLLSNNGLAADTAVAALGQASGGTGRRHCRICHCHMDATAVGDPGDRAAIVLPYTVRPGSICGEIGCCSDALKGICADGGRAALESNFLQIGAVGKGIGTHTGETGINDQFGHTAAVRIPGGSAHGIALHGTGTGDPQDSIFQEPHKVGAAAAAGRTAGGTYTVGEIVAQSRNHLLRRQDHAADVALAACGQAVGITAGCYARNRHRCMCSGNDLLCHQNLTTAVTMAAFGKAVGSTAVGNGRIRLRIMAQGRDNLLSGQHHQADRTVAAAAAARLGTGSVHRTFTDGSMAAAAETDPGDRTAVLFLHAVGPGGIACGIISCQGGIVENGVSRCGNAENRCTAKETHLRQSRTIAERIISKTSNSGGNGHCRQVCTLLKRCSGDCCNALRNAIRTGKGSRSLDQSGHRLIIKHTITIVTVGRILGIHPNAFQLRTTAEIGAADRNHTGRDGHSGQFRATAECTVSNCVHALRNIQLCKWILAECIAFDGDNAAGDRQVCQTCSVTGIAANGSNTVGNGQRRQIRTVIERIAWDLGHIVRDHHFGFQDRFSCPVLALRFGDTPADSDCAAGRIVIPVRRPSAGFGCCAAIDRKRIFAVGEWRGQIVAGGGRAGDACDCVRNINRAKAGTTLKRAAANGCNSIHIYNLQLCTAGEGIVLNRLDRNRYHKATTYSNRRTNQSIHTLGIQDTIAVRGVGRIIGIHRNIFNGRTIRKCCGRNGGNTGRNGNILQCGTAVERSITNGFDTVGNHNGLQAGAAGERIVRNQRDTAGDRNRSQPSTIGECTRL